VIAFGWAIITHGGTGAIFGFIAAREPWFSPLSPFEFIIAAFTSSLALLILVLDTQPLMARLFASVPPEVNVILLGLLPMRQATCVRFLYCS
jgi:Ni/Fe-hydrogenase subunit HybB-like protein